MDKVNGILDRFKQPALWITVLCGIYFVSVRLNDVDVIKARQEKKIKIQNDIIEKMHNHEIHMYEHMLQQKDEQISWKDEKAKLIEKIHQNELKITKIEK
jgi:hypothetical protein